MHLKRPTVRELRVRTVCVEMRSPHQTASGVVSESPLVLTDLITDEGIVGHSIVFTYTKAALKPTADLVSNLNELIIDKPVAPRALSHELASRFRLLGTQGLVGMALSAIDMALWDALSKSCGKSLVHLLGGTEKPIPVYGGVGFDGVDGSAKAAEVWAKQGFKGVKAKIGYPTVDEDIEVVRAMRSAIGPDVSIMVDYNQCLLPQEAINRIRRLESESLTWVEEPTLAHDYGGHARIAAAVDTPVQCGENWWGTRDMQQAIDACSSDYMMPDVMKIGGVTGWLRAADMADAKGILLSSHLWPELSAQLLALTPTAHWLEYADWWNPLLEEPLQIEGGMASTDNVIGTGISWNETALDKYAV